MALDTVTNTAEPASRARSRLDRLLALGTEDLRSPKAGRVLVGAIVALTCAGAALRFATLSQSVWFDEAISIRDVAGSFSQMLARVANHEASPPFYFAALWVWRQLFGHSAVDMRTLSALAGTLTIPAAFFATRRIVGDRAAVIVTAFVASSPALLYYSQELRMYALLIPLCVVAFGMFVTLLQAPSAWRFALWAALSIMALATHYFAVVAVAPQAAWLIARAWRNGSDRRATALAIAPVACAELALLVLLVYQHNRAFEYGRTILSGPFALVHFSAAVSGQSDYLPTVFQQLMIGPGGPEKPWITVAMLFIVMFCIWLLVRVPEDHPVRRGAELNILLLVPGTVLLIAMQALKLVIQGRYLFGLWLPACILAAAGLATWKNTRLAVIVTSSICALWVAIGLISFFIPRYASREDTRAVARELAMAPHDRLIAIDQPFDLPSLLLYRPEATIYSGRVVEVRELDVVLMPDRGVPTDTDAPRPSRYAIPHLPRGLVLRQTIKGDMFLIERYVSRQPVLLRLYPSAGSFVPIWRFLYERPGASVSSL